MRFATFLVLLQLAAVAECTFYSDCELSRKKNDEYLDRHEVGHMCSKTSPLTSFKLGQYSCSGNYMKYAYECFEGETQPFAEPRTEYSGCEKARGKEVEYLDRANVDCGSDAALVTFDFVGCQGNHMKYKYECVDMKLENSATYYTSCEKERHEKIQYLDRLDLACPSNTVLQSFKLEQGPCSGKNMRYKYNCATPAPEDESPPPPSPPPPAPFWVEYPQTVCKTPSTDPDDNDDGTWIRIKDISPNTLDRCKEICLETSDTPCYGVEYFSDTARCDIFTEAFTHYKKKKGRHCSLLTTEGETVFKEIGEGKCTVQNGEDPDHHYYHGMGEVECEATCKADDGCFGYSVSGHSNCLNWMQGKIDDPHVTHSEWGGAGCAVKVIAGKGKLEDYKAYVADSSQEANNASSLLILSLVGCCVAAAVVVAVVTFLRRSADRDTSAYAVVMADDL